VVAVDPHKASWTGAAVDGSLQPLATVRVPVSRDGYRALRRFAHRWPHARWAIEGAAGLGAPLTTLLRTDGIEVIDVPAKRAARMRVLSSGHGRKNDDADARSVGIAALTSDALGTAEIDAATTALRAVEHRDDLVKTRTQAVNRLHVVLTRLVAAGARRHLSADHVAELFARRAIPRRRRQERYAPGRWIWSARCASSIAAPPRPPMISRRPSAHPASVHSPRWVS
jgi:transposase